MSTPYKLIPKMIIIVGISIQNSGSFVCKLISVSLFPCKLYSMCSPIELCFVNVSPIWFFVQWVIKQCWLRVKEVGEGFPIITAFSKMAQNGFTVCLNYDTLHEICFNICIIYVAVMQMNVLFFLIFCRFQNCVYTYRILPNEDKKLSVQVRISQICTW